MTRYFPIILASFAFAFLHHVITNMMQEGILSPFLRLNFSITFTWAVAVALGCLVAARANFWVGLFLIAASVSAYYPHHTPYSEKSYQFIFYGVIWYLVCVEYLKEPKIINRMLNIICVVAIIHIVVVILQSIDINVLRTITKAQRFKSVKFELVPNIGIMDCWNSASALIALSFFAFNRTVFCWKYSINLRWFFPFLIYGLVLTRTFAGPLALSIALICYAAYKFKNWSHKIFVICLSGWGLMFYAAFVDVPDISWRWSTWKFAALKLIPQHWFLGSGLNHWQFVMSRDDVVRKTLGLLPQYKQIMGEAHNDFLQGFFEMGISFPLIFIGFIVSIVMCKVKKEYRRIAVNSYLTMIVMLIIGNVFFVIRIPLLAMLILTWMAIHQNSLRTS